MRRFKVHFEICEITIDTGVIEIDQSVIDHVDDEWRNTYCDLYDCVVEIFTPEEIASFISFHMIVNGLRLSQIDGFEDFDDNLAKIIQYPDIDVEWGVSATEITS